MITTRVANRIGQQNLIPSAVGNLNSHQPKAKKAEQFDIGLNPQAVEHQHHVEKQQEVLAALLGEKPLPVSKKEKQSADSESEQAVNEPFKPQTITHPVMIATRADLTSSTVQQWDQKYRSQVETPAASFQIHEEQAEEKISEPSPRRFPDLKYIGQLHGTYLLAEADDGFYLLDQHAAQERVKYEFYREEIGSDNPAEQKMLVPLVLTYSVSDALKIEQNRDKLAQLGINLEDFGQNTYIVHEHPAWIPAGKEEETIRNLIEECLADPQLTVAKFREATAIMISCKQSIKANHHLERQQAVALLRQLKECENPFNCPHGRPTVVKFSNQDLERMFKRIQDSHRSLRETKNAGD